MKPKISHPWKVDPVKAARIQGGLLALVRQGPPLDISRVRLVAAADVSYRRGDTRMFGAVVVMRYPSMESVESRWGSMVPSFPYVPGLLAFREAPVLMPAFRRLRYEPDVVMFDGHGLAHPRGMGLATHMGILLGTPAVGVAKKVLVGEYSAPGLERGSYTNISYGDRVVGVALRTREKIKPVFVSVGCHIDLDSARELVMACCRGYRICEPVRAAHALCNEKRTKVSP